MEHGDQIGLHANMDIYISRNKISCAYWLLSVNCLLGSHYLNEGVSHHRQISSLLNRILAPFTCHQENSSITTLRASLPTTIIILSDVFLVDGFLHICPPSEDSLFVARGSILFMPESPDAAQIGLIPSCHSLWSAGVSLESCGPFIYGSTTPQPWLSFDSCSHSLYRYLPGTC